MKVEILTTLKSGPTKYWSKGDILTAPLPPEIISEIHLNRKTVRVIEEPAPIESSETTKETPKKVLLRKK